MAHWQSILERWRNAGLIDQSTAQRIHDWEVSEGDSVRRNRLAPIAFGLGGLLLTAGVLLFVAAHWDDLSPALRFTLLLVMIGLFHGLATAIRARSPTLSTTLHAVGAASLGAGIYLSGQIFNMAEHWPGALMLWSIGAAAAWYLLRDWPQALWIAILVPGWLFAEWIEYRPRHYPGADTAVIAGLILLAIVYLSARGTSSSTDRTALARLGAIALVPLAAWLSFEIQFPDYWSFTGEAPPQLGQTQLFLGWGLAIVLPAGLAVALRGRDALWLLAPIAWIAALVFLSSRTPTGELTMYFLFALGAVGIAVWGLREQQRLTVNIGVLGFAVTILAFYFASLFDKLGRSLGLIALGAIFIGGGWLLERTRRRLVERIARGSP